MPQRSARLADRSDSAVGSRARVGSVGVLAVLLAVLTATTLIASGFALVLAQQLDEGEPVVYGLAARLSHHEQLYQPADRPPYVQAYYTPTYFYAVAGLRKYFGPGFQSGRALSIAAGLFAAAVLAYLAGSRAGSWLAGGFASLMFLGLGFPLAPVPFLALERVDLLGIAFGVACIAVLTVSQRSPGVLAAGVLAGLAVLTKQTLFAAGLAGALWLLTVSPRKALLFAVAAAATTLVPAAILQWSSSGAFWDNIGPANTTPISLAMGAYLAKQLVTVQAAATVLAVVYVIRTRAWKDPRARLLVIYWVATALPLVGMVKLGANHNYWIEFAAANAVLATLCIWSCLQIKTVASIIPIWLLAAQLAVLTPARLFENQSAAFEVTNWTLLFDRLTTLTREVPEFNHLVQDVSGETGIVISESMDIAVLADQPVHIEPFAYSMYEMQGKWNSAPLVDKICAGHVSLLLLSYPLEKVPGLEGVPAWPPSLTAAFRRSMQFEQVRAFHWLYRPKPSLDADTMARCQAEAEAARQRLSRVD